MPCSRVIIDEGRPSASRPYPSAVARERLRYVVGLFLVSLRFTTNIFISLYGAAAAGRRDLYIILGLYRYYSRSYATGNGKNVLVLSLMERLFFLLPNYWQTCVLLCWKTCRDREPHWGVNRLSVKLYKMSCNCLYIFRLPVTRKKNGVVLLHLYSGLAFAWEEDIVVDSGSELPSYTTGPSNHQRGATQLAYMHQFLYRLANWKRRPN